MGPANISSLPNPPTTPLIPVTTFLMEHIAAMLVELLSAAFTACKQSLMRLDNSANDARASPSACPSAASWLARVWSPAIFASNCPRSVCCCARVFRRASSSVLEAESWPSSLLTASQWSSRLSDIIFMLAAATPNATMGMKSIAIIDFRLVNKTHVPRSSTPALTPMWTALCVFSASSILFRARVSADRADARLSCACRTFASDVRMLSSVEFICA